MPYLANFESSFERLIILSTPPSCWYKVITKYYMIYSHVFYLLYIQLRYYSQFFNTAEMDSSFYDRGFRVTQYQTVTNIFYYFSSEVPGYCSHCIKKNLLVFSDLFWIINTRSNPCRIDYINKTNTTILSSNEGYFVFLIHHVLHNMI